MVGPPRRGHPAACLARANRIGPAAPAGGRNAARLCRPSGFLGPRRPACRQGAAGRAPRDRRTAQPKGGRGVKTDGQTHSACGGAAKGGMGAGAAHPMTVGRIPGREPRARRRPGSRAAKRRRGTPNGPAGLRSGQRQRRAGNQIPCPVDFIAFNGTRHGYFCLMYLLKL